ncbi:MAG: Anhydro-N-acetylmuramic acid kinase [Phycisphaerae bacterium]|nr:Anhydro-N-acetylmuramic acid kinase [Phycisphaerae bacterium]
MRRLAVGCMTGTSLDALDAATVEIAGHSLSMRAAARRFVSRPLGALAPELRQIADQHPVAARQVADVARRLALLHVHVLRELLDGQSPALICVHGQTVFHQPPLSWQLLNPAPIAEALATPVVFDLRAADLAAGGQGAPITPLADAILFADARERRAIVNLGGFCNVTLLPPRGEPHDDANRAAWLNQIDGGDVCSCNHVLDALARELLGAPYDAGGAAAARGRALPHLRSACAALLAAQSAAGRSLGSGDELITAVIALARGHAPHDALASLCAAIADTIAPRVHPADRLIIAGGGARNRTLVDSIAAHTSTPVAVSDDFGVPLSHREAVAMAVLGALCQDRVPITLPRITRATRPVVSGVWIVP